MHAQGSAGNDSGVGAPEDGAAGPAAAPAAAAGQLLAVPPPPPLPPSPRTRPGPSLPPFQPIMRPRAPPPQGWAPPPADALR